jgi:hypothetical protein
MRMAAGNGLTTCPEDRYPPGNHFCAVARGAYERAGDQATADRLLARAGWVTGGHGLRCLISYRAIGGLAAFTHERQAYGDSLGDAECAAVSAVLDLLEATPDQQPEGPRTPRGPCGMTRARVRPVRSEE